MADRGLVDFSAHTRPGTKLTCKRIIVGSVHWLKIESDGLSVTVFAPDEKHLDEFCEALAQPQKLLEIDAQARELSVGAEQIKRIRKKIDCGQADNEIWDDIKRLVADEIAGSM